MMTTVSLKVSYIDGDTTGSFTVSYVNPESTYEQLNTFARSLINLSNNTYIDSTRIVSDSVNEHIAEEG